MKSKFPTTIFKRFSIRLRRRPRLRAETPTYTKRCCEGGHSGVQARPMALDECEEDNPPKPCTWEGMLRRIPPRNMEVPRALPVGLHETSAKRLGTY